MTKKEKRNNVAASGHSVQCSQPKLPLRVLLSWFKLQMPVVSTGYGGGNN